MYHLKFVKDVKDINKFRFLEPTPLYFFLTCWRFLGHAETTAGFNPKSSKRQVQRRLAAAVPCQGRWWLYWDSVRDAMPCGPVAVGILQKVEFYNRNFPFGFFGMNALYEGHLRGTTFISMFDWRTFVWVFKTSSASPWASLGTTEAASLMQRQ